jgi:hypothetical protein
VFIVALVATFLVWHPARVAVQTLLLLPALFPSAPFDPLELITPAPTREQHVYAYAAGTVEADLFHPRADGRRGAIVLLLGAGDVPRSDLAVHFAGALARLGVVTLLPQSSGMLAERLTFEEVDAIRASLALLATQADVDTARVGLVGLSASGGLGIVAAGQPDLRDRIRFVNSFGSYYDTRSLLVDVASHSVDVGGSVRPWEPEARTVDVIALALGGAGIRDQLLPGTMGGAGMREQLLRGTTREQATSLVSNLPPSVAQALASVSPSAYLSEVRAHLYLMHDVDDSFIPFTESRQFVAQAPRGIVQRHTEFAIFAHVIPDRPVPWQTFLPDIWRLFWHVHAVLLEVL